MKFNREILEMLPCPGGICAQFETKDGEIELIPIVAFARCITYFDQDDECCDCDNCKCNIEEDCDGCNLFEDEDDSKELVIPMVVMNDEDYLRFADEYGNYIGMKRL